MPKVMIFEEIKFEDNLSLLHVTDGMVAMLKAIMQTHGTYWRTWSVCPTVSDITYMSEVESLYMYFGVWQSVLDQWHVLYSSTICLYPHEGTSTFRHCCKVYEISVSFTMTRTSFTWVIMSVQPLIHIPCDIHFETAYNNNVQQLVALEILQAIWKQQSTLSNVNYLNICMYTQRRNKEYSSGA